MSTRRIDDSAAAQWDPEVFARNPLFADLDRLFAPQRWRDWPDLGLLSAGLGDRLVTDPDDVPRFVPQRAGEAVPALAYERHITQHGEVRTRERNWHDLFNAFAWWLFPRTRRWLSAAHNAGEPQQVTGRRTPRRDALTLFDECGVVLIATDGHGLAELHAQHRWRELFVDRRALWGRQAGALILGHGLYEQCLAPYVGLTGKSLWLTVDATVLRLPPAQRYAAVDRILVERLAAGRELHSPRELLPLPILGVPGWWPANRDAAFYSNERYFRPRRPNAPRRSGFQPRSDPGPPHRVP